MPAFTGLGRGCSGPSPCPLHSLCIPPALLHSCSRSLCLLLLSCASPSLPPPCYLCPFSPRCSRGTEIGCDFGPLKPFQAPSTSRRSSRLRCHGDGAVWRRPQLASPKQCRAKCRFLAPLRALFPSDGASGLRWALHLDTTTIPTPSLSPLPCFPSSLPVFDLLKIKRTKSQRKVGFVVAATAQNGALQTKCGGTEV